MTVPAIAFITLGCPKNEVDTDRMRAAVVASAYSLADDPETADIVVVNTCSFIRDATEESVATVLAVATDWLPERKGRFVVVAGCMPSRYGDDLAEAMPEVAAFVPISEESQLLSVVERLTGVAADLSCDSVPPSRTACGPSAYLQVSDGCHRACAYCAIPAIRGPYVSRALADIVTEAAELVSLGARELVLIGQDITAYGRDLNSGEVLADVVRAVAAVPGADWIRLMYVQPDGVTDDLLHAIAENANVVRYLDIPLQHAAKPVLRAMRRSGDAARFLSLIARIRAVLPDVALRTTLIAGFPGETTADVRETQRFLEAARFDVVGVFVYSPEEGTAAADMPGQIPLRTRRARAQRLRDTAEVIGFERAAERVGTVVEVLVEGSDEDEGVIIGRWRGQAPEVDGVVVLGGGVSGQIVHATVVDSLGYDLECEVISS